LGVRTPEGLVVTAQGARFDDLGAADLVAVMDVDPVRGVMLCGGPGEPSAWAAVLWLVMRHRTDLGAFLSVAPVTSASSRSTQGDDATRPAGPLEATRSKGWGFQAEDNDPTGLIGPTAAEGGSIVQSAGTVLKALRSTNLAGLSGGRVVCVGGTLGQAMDAYTEHFEESAVKKR
jgi:hypothetical protein